MVLMMKRSPAPEAIATSVWALLHDRKCRATSHDHGSEDTRDHISGVGLGRQAVGSKGSSQKPHDQEVGKK